MMMTFQRIRLLTTTSVSLLVFLLLTTIDSSAQAATMIRIPFLSSSNKKNKYTPLVFFKVPPGLIPECDAMERTVQEVEKELGVRVERLDILRDPAAEAAMALLTQRTPPFLYHRESCQIVTTVSPEGAGKARVRAWAKGRLLQARRVGMLPSGGTKKAKAPVVLSQEDNAISQEELLEDMALTPQQREGKKRMKERTEALRK